MNVPHIHLYLDSHMITILIYNLCNTMFVFQVNRPWCSHFRCSLWYIQLWCYASRRWCPSFRWAWKWCQTISTNFITDSIQQHEVRRPKPTHFLLLFCGTQHIWQILDVAFFLCLLLETRDVQNGVYNTLKICNIQ